MRGHHEPLLSMEMYNRIQERLYGYYACHNKACPDRRKSIRKEKVESEFSEALKQLQETGVTDRVYQKYFNKL